MIVRPPSPGPARPCCPRPADYDTLDVLGSKYYLLLLLPLLPSRLLSWLRLPGPDGIQRAPLTMQAQRTTSWWCWGPSTTSTQRAGAVHALRQGTAAAAPREQPRLTPPARPPSTHPAQTWSNWAKARATCQARGLELASIPSKVMADELHCLSGRSLPGPTPLVLRGRPRQR
jgi:hypothetical protein